MRWQIWCGGAVLGAVLALGGCAARAPEGPAIESPAGEPRYAVAYPDLIERDIAELDAIDTEVEEATGKFASFPEELEDPPWPRVQEIVELADAAGRSRGYVERHDETSAVERFFVEEDTELKNKVGGAAVYTGKQQGCSDPGTLGGTINRVLEKTVDERLEERLREGNVAHGAIDRHEPQLGEQNAEKLRDQVDAITAASFAVHIEAVRLKLDLERRIDEAKDIEKTLEQAAVDWEGLAKDGERSEAEREEAKENAKAVREAKAKLDSVVEKAEGAEKDLEERIEALQDRYEERLQELLAAIEKKQ